MKYYVSAICEKGLNLEYGPFDTEEEARKALPPDKIEGPAIGWITYWPSTVNDAASN